MSLKSILTRMVENPTTVEGKKLKAATERIAVLEQELADMKRQNESLTQQNKWLERANEALGVEKREAVAKVADLEALRSEHAEVLTQFEKLKKYAASLRLKVKTQTENAVRLERRASLLQEQLQMAKDEAMELRKRLVSSLGSSEP